MDRISVFSTYESDATMMKPLNLCLLGLAAYLALVPIARASIPAPFFNQRVVEPTGRYYVVIKALPLDAKIGETEYFPRVKVWLAEAKSGAPQPTSASDREQKVVGIREHNPDVCVRDGDIVLCSRELDEAPSEVAVSSSGLGFACSARVVGHQKSIARLFVSSDGKLRFKKLVYDLFTEEEWNQFPDTSAGVDWDGGGWIDDARRQLIVVGGRLASKERLFRAIDIETGAVSPATSGIVVAVLKDVNRGALELALELTVELRLSNALDHLPALFTNEQLPHAVRLRSAVALAVLDDLRGERLIVASAVESADSYAVTHLNLLGEKGAPIIRDVVSRHGLRATGDAVVALSALQAHAVPTLIEMLQNKDDSEGQYVAAEAVRRIGQPALATVPALIDVLTGCVTTDESHWSIEARVADALGRFGPAAEAALPALKSFRARAKEYWEALPLEQRRKGWSGVYLSAVEAVKQVQTTKSNRRRR
jgi:hypothetical protein